MRRGGGGGGIWGGGRGGGGGGGREDGDVFQLGRLDIVDHLPIVELHRKSTVPVHPCDRPPVVLFPVQTLRLQPLPRAHLLGPHGVDHHRTGVGSIGCIGCMGCMGCGHTHIGGCTSTGGAPGCASARRTAWRHVPETSLAHVHDPRPKFLVAVLLVTAAAPIRRWRWHRRHGGHRRRHRRIGVDA